MSTIPFPFFSKPPINRLIGHRGCPRLAPENSLAGFTLAKESGLNWVEFDVQVTVDNHLMLMHDDTIDRTSTGTGKVYELTLSQIQAASLKHTDLPVPTLIESMSLLKQLNLYANIELKLPENLLSLQVASIRAKLFSAFVQYLYTYWPQHQLRDTPWPLISSFDHDILLQVRKLFLDIPLGFLVQEPNLEHLALAKQYAPASIHAQFTFLTKEYIELAKKQNTPVLAYTVNSLKEAEQLLHWGAYALFTDMGNQLKYVNIPS